MTGPTLLVDTTHKIQQNDLPLCKKKCHHSGSNGSDLKTYAGIFEILEDTLPKISMDTPNDGLEKVMMVWKSRLGSGPS